MKGKTSLVDYDVMEVKANEKGIIYEKRQI
jgi:hypothetical protein